MDRLLRYAFMLPPDALRGAAKQARRLADDMEAAADRKDYLKKAAERARERRRNNSTLVDMIATYIHGGISSRQALECVQKQTGIEWKILLSFERPAIKEANRQWLRVRNRRIVQLCRQGYSDKEIADRTAHPLTGKTLHTKYINKLIRKNFEILRSEHPKKISL